MAWVKFVFDFEFDFRPHKACCQVYRASDMPVNLPERVVAAAVAAGAGVRVEVEHPEDPKPEAPPPTGNQRASRRKQQEK